jgi:hypothetical protein
VEAEKIKRQDAQRKAAVRADEEARKRQAKKRIGNDESAYPVRWREKDKKILLDRVKEKYQ